MIDPDFPLYINTSKLLPASGLEIGLQKFAQCDSEELFLKNTKIQPTNWHYHSKDVYYQFNSSAYRTSEWKDINWEDSVVIFGCSIVLGLGVSEDETIGYYLSQILNRPVVNLGQSATSIFYSLYNAVCLDQNFPTPWGVVNCWTSSNRVVEATDCMLVHRYSTFYDQWNFYKTNPSFHSHFFKLLGKSIWNNKARYASGSFFDTHDRFFDTVDRARDLIHPGPRSNLSAAKVLAKDLITSTSSNG